MVRCDGSSSGHVYMYERVIVCMLNKGTLVCDSMVCRVCGLDVKVIWFLNSYLKLFKTLELLIGSVYACICWGRGLGNICLMDEK